MFCWHHRLGAGTGVTRLVGKKNFYMMFGMSIINLLVRYEDPFLTVWKVLKREGVNQPHHATTEGLRDSTDRLL